MYDKRDRAIIYVFCRDLHLTPMFSDPLQIDLIKEMKFGGKFCFKKIIVTLVAQGLPSSFLSHPVAQVH